MKPTRKKSIAKMTDDGITYCENCKEELLCDKYGDMPDYCPACGRKLDWTEFVRLTTDSDQPEEESK